MARANPRREALSLKVEGKRARSVYRFAAVIALIGTPRRVGSARPIKRGIVYGG